MHEEGEGVAIYIHNTIDYTEVEVNITIEAVAVHTRDIIIACAYNKP